MNLWAAAGWAHPPMADRRFFWMSPFPSSRLELQAGSIPVSSPSLVGGSDEIS